MEGRCAGQTQSVGRVMISWQGIKQMYMFQGLQYKQACTHVHVYMCNFYEGGHGHLLSYHSAVTRLLVRP